MDEKIGNRDLFNERRRDDLNNIKKSRYDLKGKNRFNADCIKEA